MLLIINELFIQKSKVIAFQLELDMMDKYYRKMSRRGMTTYNISCLVLSIWHYHNGIVDL